MELKNLNLFFKIKMNNSSKILQNNAKMIIQKMKS